MKLKLFIITLALSFALFANAQPDTLFVYGPGGPQAPMEECAKIFSKNMLIPVKIIAGPETNWIDQAKQNADLVFGGAEYMLTQFAVQHPGLIDSSTRTELYKRAAGILVRKGNPKKITSLKDLTKPGVRILNVNGAGQLGLWEDIAGKQNLIGGIQKNILRSFPNTGAAVNAWKTDNSYDAIIIYSSWYYRLKDVSQLVKIRESQTVYRGTPIAITNITNQKKEARQFIQFLLSNEGHLIFKKWGWE
jgi:accessory colonization factor AcfC